MNQITNESRLSMRAGTQRKVEFNPTEAACQMGDTKLIYQDVSIGSRILVGLKVDDAAVRRRVKRQELRPFAIPDAKNSEGGAFAGANLLCVFNDFLLNHEATGEIPKDFNPRYVGFNIPCIGAFPSKINMYHFRVYTGDKNAVPGKFGDYEAAELERGFKLTGSGTRSHVEEYFRVHPERGGLVELQLDYDRKAATRQGSSRPDFWVWADKWPGRVRAYRDDSVWETILSRPQGIDWTTKCMLNVDVEELRDLFDGNEKPIAVVTQPFYLRTVFSN